ncbi:type-F conjugative transfer system pilin assembly protein TrbC [Blastomonas sp. CCH2-E1]|jgi:conjugal transfer pilus assembly protein TrbC|uniref:type-F conjugative transfer system pilin assembly protein TrbC n=1 Tax=Blastomonas sp. CCH2-E1 TaxID=1768740 RepID=UPI000823FD84|nr:type-F conjugative transfer system pilin assembly protein TrbC [Blastomonas sp. CCH2-E1]
MKIFPQILVGMGLTAASALAGAAVQTSEPELDLAAIRAKAQSGAGEAEALAASARTRAKAILDQADATADQAMAHGQEYARTTPTAAPQPSDPIFDFDEMVAAAGTAAKGDLGEAPRFIAFASLSMPPQALREMITRVNAAGGVVALRGFPEGSAKALTEALGKVGLGQEQMGSVGIDPRLFRAFNVTAVPTYVVASTDFDLCDGFDCQTQVPPHDRLSGNVTADYALETIARGGGPAARMASQYLARLKGAEQ